MRCAAAGHDTEARYVSEDRSALPGRTKPAAVVHVPDRSLTIRDAVVPLPRAVQAPVGGQNSPYCGYASVRIARAPDPADVGRARLPSQIEHEPVRMVQREEPVVDAAREGRARR